MIEAIGRDGYIIAQAYVPAAKKGDIRFFLMNGRPLQIGGKYAALRRVASKDDIRSNIHAGGTAEAVEIGETELRVAEMIRPKLIADGMFLVGIDIVGDKILEVNVFSPGQPRTAARRSPGSISRCRSSSRSSARSRSPANMPRPSTTAIWQFCEIRARQAAAHELKRGAGDPYGIRTRISAVKGPRPNP